MLRKFEHYVKLFQSEKPLIHMLYTEIVDLLKTFLAGFMKPDCIPTSQTEFENLDLTNPDIVKTPTFFNIGKYALPPLEIAKREPKNAHWIEDLYSNLVTAYTECAKMLLKLPVLNSQIRRCAALSPALQTISEGAFFRMAMKLPNVIAPDDLGSLRDDCQTYACDTVLQQTPYDNEDMNIRVDQNWWNIVFRRKDTLGNIKYPMLTKLVKALLSIICGPLVESTFNIMDDILESDRTKLTPYNFEAYSIIKYHLAAHGMVSHEMTVAKPLRQSIKHAHNTMTEYEKKQAKNNRLKKLYIIIFVKASKKRKCQLLLLPKRLQCYSLHQPIKKPLLLPPPKRLHLCHLHQPPPKTLHLCLLHQPPPKRLHLCHLHQPIKKTLLLPPPKRLHPNIESPISNMHRFLRKGNWTISPLCLIF